MEDFIDPHWYCYVCRRVVKDDDQLEKRQQRPINEIWGTALGRKPHPSTSVTVVEKSVKYGFFGCFPNRLTYRDFFFQQNLEVTQQYPNGWEC